MVRPGSAKPLSPVRVWEVPPKFCWCGGMVDARDLKSLGSNTVPVRVRPPAPKRVLRLVFFMDFKSRGLIPVGTRPQQVAPRLWLKTCHRQLFFTRRPLGSFCRNGSEPEHQPPNRLLGPIFFVIFQVTHFLYFKGFKSLFLTHHIFVILLKCNIFFVSKVV